MRLGQTEIEIRPDECIRTGQVQNGYFYILFYAAGTWQARNEGYDETPVIYCAMPDERNVNNFWGINFNYFTEDVREYIVKGFQTRFDILSEDRRVILDGRQLYDIYSNMAIGLRCYSRKNVYDCYRVRSQYLLGYIGLGGKFNMITRRDVERSFDLAPGNKGF